ncbi:hypothetical protein DL93DRAFT_2137712 [Clavulina sp. PMI_390]|nr:hypothetical protein DL93DRAFT_2137712 [Clavulina sp. PMI_390]
MSKEEAIRDKLGEEIDIGDEVSTRMRGGKRVGPVDDIVLTQEEADAKGVKNPPKVILKDQHGHVVNHNPETLVHGDDPTISSKGEANK